MLFTTTGISHLTKYTSGPIHLLSVQQNNYRLITAYLLLQVNLDKIMHVR